MYIGKLSYNKKIVFNLPVFQPEDGSAQQAVNSKTL